LTDGQHAPARKNPSPAVFIGIGVAVVVVAGVIVAFALTRNKSSSPGTVSGSSSYGGFQFSDVKYDPVTTVVGADQKKANNAAKQASVQVTSQLNTLYGEGFLDPANWQKGSYASALAVFDAHAAAQAQQQIDTLTAGTAAGASFTTITPQGSKLHIDVLVDKGNNPVSAIGELEFRASAMGKDGTVTKLISKATYIFTQEGGVWKITSFNVQREDKQGGASPSAGATGSATP
jgi:ketosteroid isomerase-like protein